MRVCDSTKMNILSTFTMQKYQAFITCKIQNHPQKLSIGVLLCNSPLQDQIHSTRYRRTKGATRKLVAKYFDGFSGAVVAQCSKKTVWFLVVKSVTYRKHVKSAISVKILAIMPNTIGLSAAFLAFMVYYNTLNAGFVYDDT